MAPLVYISGRLIAAARVLCGMTQAELARQANISVSTLKRFESGGLLGEVGTAVLPNNALAVIRALEEAGIQFIEPGDESFGAGVVLRNRNSPETA